MEGLFKQMLLLTAWQTCLYLGGIKMGGVELGGETDISASLQDVAGIAGCYNKT